MSLKLTKDLANNLIIFLILFLSVSFVVTNNVISSIMTIGLWIFTLLLILYVGKLRISVEILTVTVVTSCLMLFSVMLNGEDFFSVVKNIFAIFCVMMLSSYITFKEFSKIFVKIMKILCLISLVGYVSHLIFPGLFSFFIVQNNAGVYYSNWFLYVQWISGGSAAYRNWGFAWEPGAFATFVCLSMMLDIFVCGKNIKFRTVALYLLTVFSTLSTTGIIAAICLCMYLVVINRTMSKKIKGTIATALVILILTMIIFSGFLFDLSTSSVFGKIINFFNSDNDGQVTSASVRVNSITKVIEAFFKKPLLGWGYTSLSEYTYEYTHGMNTCTFINWFAVYGVIFGALMSVGMYQFTKKITKGTLNRIILFIFLFGITMTENYVDSPVIFLLVFMGYRRRRYSPVPISNISIEGLENENTSNQLV